MESDLTSSTNQDNPIAIRVPQAIRGAALTLAGGFALTAGGVASVTAAWLAVSSQPASADGLLVLAAATALALGALFLVWGSRTMVASGVLTTSRQDSRPFLGILGLLFACVAVYLLVAGLALVGLSVLAEAVNLPPLIALADPLAIGVLLMVSAIPVAAIGGRLIAGSRCMVGLRAMNAADSHVVAG